MDEIQVPRSAPPGPAGETAPKPPSRRKKEKRKPAASDPEVDAAPSPISEESPGGAPKKLDLLT